MSRPANNCFLWPLALLLALSAAAQASLFSFLSVCPYNEKRVACLPSCQRICTTSFQWRKCTAIECEVGCVCRPGWLRKGVINGPCIRQSSCTRWIL